MYALIMAGGRGTRLGQGEKALARVLDKPLLSYVLAAVTDAGLDPVVITSPHTPYTANYCRIHDILWICTDGKGYVEDIRQAITELSIKGPCLTICADLPGITAEHIKIARDTFEKSGFPAGSVWVPSPNGHAADTLPGIPVGMNILTGALIDEEQNEIQILISDPLLALNVNTPEDLADAERLLSLKRM